MTEDRVMYCLFRVISYPKGEDVWVIRRCEITNGGETKRNSEKKIS
jgi:hypothetical protein